MASFPLTCMYRTFASPEELTVALREDAQLGPRRRQDEHAAESWLAEMEDDPALAQAVQEAALGMLASESDPRTLDLILILGARGGQRFHEAAARRVLEGPPLPAPGPSGLDAAASLIQRACGVADPVLRSRLYAVLSPIDRLRMSLDERSPRLPDDFRAALEAGGLSAILVCRVALVACSLGPDCLAAAAQAARALSAEARAAFHAEALEYRPERREALEAIFGL